MEALRGDDRSSSQGRLPTFGKGLLTVLRDFARIFAFHLFVGPFSISFYLALAIIAGAVVALLFNWPAIYPVLAACLAVVIINPRRRFLNARKRRESYYRS